jgi:D-alanyl-D-alanine endopeptidase (penicillin-binding protein 7)
LAKRFFQFSIAFIVLFLISEVPWGELFITLTDVRNTRETKDHDGEAIPLKAFHLTQKALENKLHKIVSKAAVVVDIEKGEILFEKNMEEPTPIASLTKLMTAVVFLEQNPNLDDTATIFSCDAESSGRSRLRVGETLTLNDLLHASLMSSNNLATKTLVRVSGLPYDDFIDRMNQKAKKIGLENTHFYEPTGLDENNQSTALDCARLLAFALRDKKIASITTKKTYAFTSLYKKKGRRHQITNTNSLLFQDGSNGTSSLNVKGGKTGYNGPSGWCLATLVENEDGTRIAAVVLGAPTSLTRFRETKSIIKWSSLQQAQGGERSRTTKKATEGT